MMDDDEADLRRFAGPVADRYLAAENRRLLDRMRAQNFALWPPVRSFCWPALFVPVQWLLYRKLHLEAGLAMLGTTIIAVALPSAYQLWLALPLGLLVALIGHPLFLHKIAGDRAIADQLALEGAARDAFARRTGGRSRAGLWLGLTFLVAGFVTPFIVSIAGLHAPTSTAVPILGPVPTGVSASFAAITTVIPSLGWLVYRMLGLSHRDRVIWNCVGLGAVAAWAGGALEGPAIAIVVAVSGTLFGTAVSLSIVAGLTEEALKLLVLAGIVIAESPLVPRRDWAKLGMLIGIGFGIAENMAVLAVGSQQVIALLRASTAVPLHGCLGLLVGWLLARGTAEGPHGWPRIMLIFACAAAIHTLYDLPLLLVGPSLANALNIGWGAPMLTVVIVMGISVLRSVAPPRRLRRGAIALALVIFLIPLVGLGAGWTRLAELPLSSPPTLLQIIGFVVLASVGPFLLGGELLFRVLRAAPGGALRTTPRA